MNVALVGTRWFGAQTLKRLIARGDDVTVVALHAEEHLAKAAEAAGVPVITLDGVRRVRAEHIPDDVDVIVAAHSHAFITAEARDRARLAAIGYHPSLLPRHRGIAAVEWTIRCGDPIAGGSIYHLTDGMDEGPIAAQDWCFVYPDDDATSLWRRALAPMGLDLTDQVLAFIDRHGYAEAQPQNPKAVTFAPSLKLAEA